MRQLLHVCRLSICAGMLAGCASWSTPPVQVGEAEADVVARLGQPTHVYQDGNSRLLEYMHGPMGQTTDMARIGPDGKLVSYQQVLSLQNFGTIHVNEAHKADVLRTVGAPSEDNYFPRQQLEAWSYPFKESGVWDSMMTIFFDQAGIVRKLENGPDPH